MGADVLLDELPCDFDVFAEDGGLEQVDDEGPVLGDVLQEGREDPGVDDERRHRVEETRLLL